MIYENLKDKKVLVTGSSSDIGTETASAQDVAKTILFLANEAADFIVGEYIAVNGGLYMKA